MFLLSLNIVFLGFWLWVWLGVWFCSIEDVDLPALWVLQIFPAVSQLPTQCSFQIQRMPWSSEDSLLNRVETETRHHGSPFVQPYKSVFLRQRAGYSKVESGSERHMEDGCNYLCLLPFSGHCNETFVSQCKKIHKLPSRYEIISGH